MVILAPSLPFGRLPAIYTETLTPPAANPPRSTAPITIDD